MASTKGTIKRLVSDKGFGFIAAGDGNEYFFHQSACSGIAFDDLREGQAAGVAGRAAPAPARRTGGHVRERAGSQGSQGGKRPARLVTDAVDAVFDSTSRCSNSPPFRRFRLLNT